MSCSIQLFVLIQPLNPVKLYTLTHSHTGRVQPVSEAGRRDRQRKMRDRRKEECYNVTDNTSNFECTVCYSIPFIPADGSTDLTSSTDLPLYDLSVEDTWLLWILPQHVLSSFDFAKYNCNTAGCCNHMLANYFSSVCLILNPRLKSRV